MAKNKGIVPAGYDGGDKVRHVIISHGSKLISVPKELWLKAGLERGVDVEVDIAKDNPHILIVTVLNPFDHSGTIKELLEKEAAKKKATAKRAAKKIEAAKKATAEKEKKAEKKAAVNEKEERAKEFAKSTAVEDVKLKLALKHGKSVDVFPEGWKVGDPTPFLELGAEEPEKETEGPAK